MARRSKYPARLLIQRLGSQWYVFSEIDGECFYTPLEKGFSRPRRTKKNVKPLKNLRNH